MGRRWLDALLARPLPISHTTAYAWYAAAWLAYANHDYPAGRATLETRWRMSGELGQPIHMKDFGLGLFALAEGDISGAGVVFEQHLALVNEHTDFERAWAHYGLGAYHLMAGNPIEAQTCFETSLALFRVANETVPVIDTLRKLGLAVQAQSDLSRALTLFRESIELAHARHYRRAIAASLLGFAGVALNQGALEQAARLFGAAEALSEMTSVVDADERYLSVPNVAALRKQLDPATLEARWAEGWELDWKQAVALALSNVE